MSSFSKQTRLLFLSSRILCSPLEAVFTLLIFILSKELHASLLQLTLLAATKPLVSLLSYYTSTFVVGKTQKIRSYLIAMNFVGCLPCLLFPFIDNTWYFIASYMLFITALRSSFPSWAELLKTNVGVQNMGSLISKGTSITHSLIIFAPLILASYMDYNPNIWKWVFFTLAFVQMLNSFFLLFLPMKEYPPTAIAPISLKNVVLAPWKKGWDLFRSDKEFTRYLAVFFLGGVGLVALQPVLPIYFTETLHLSYKQLAAAYSCCSGIAFVCSSPIWARWVNHMTLYLLNTYINLFICLFIVCLLASSGNTCWLLPAYIMYGTMQAGCELSWNLSGPVFSGTQESTLYSSLNLALVGVRGCICPFFGQLLCTLFSPTVVFITAGVITFIGALYAMSLHLRANKQNCIEVV